MYFFSKFQASSNQDADGNLDLDNQNITLTKSVEFLDMHLDSNLSWALHAEIQLKN